MSEGLQGAKKQTKARRRKGSDKDWQWDPFKEGSWHPRFAVDSVTVSEAKQAVQKVEGRRAAVRGSGSADEADRPETGMHPSHSSAKLHASQVATC